ncbi:helix-turn-helix transcriptional regulator [Saxibacter everestensis]|uniref:Helix-turn-helix transcriptional regulator n=1 Tax=Saxibacter everestensis TaxID=2909229 RepID=A0ABY8QX38_9MICO|nr:helix-turn-helix transcriptional regulator [Brevibacteriaceae bacterium ZFBP1038]
MTMLLLREILGDALRRIRVEQKRSLREVAGTARVSVPYLSEIERGRKEVSSEILAAICRALHLDLRSLLSELRFQEEATVITLRSSGDIAAVGSQRRPVSGNAVLRAA